MSGQARFEAIAALPLSVDMAAATALREELAASRRAVEAYRRTEDEMRDQLRGIRRILDGEEE